MKTYKITFNREVKAKSEFDAMENLSKEFIDKNTTLANELKIEEIED